MQQKQYNQFAEEQEPDIPMGIPVGNLIHNPQQPNSAIPQPHYPHPPQYMQPPHQMALQPPQTNNLANLQMQPNIMKGKPISTVCPCCKYAVNTVVNVEPGNSTYLWSAALCVCFFPWPCYCAPFLLDSCQDKNHFCPNCGFNILRKHQGCFQFCQ